MFADKTTKSRLIGFCLLMLTTYTSFAFRFNMAYVEVNSNPLENVRCYIRSDNHKPFFGYTAIFAGNINGTEPNRPEIYFNEHVQAVLNSSQVQSLRHQGIKVLMTLLGNHQNAGWSCMTSQKAANKFADKIVQMINKHHLDGVDIDDEYSTCTPNDYSLIMLAQAIKSHKGFKGKILTKALFEDSQYFTATYNDHHLSDYLDYGWEMSYSSDDFLDRLAPYLNAGMHVDQLMIGGSVDYITFPSPFQMGQYATQASLAGIMVYNVTNSSQYYLTQLLQGLLSDGQATVNIQPNCLK